jgi:uncharacterized protein (TIGR02597 family)
MKLSKYALIAAAFILPAAAQTAYTSPVGYVSQTCLKSSDTFIGVPMRQPAVAAAALTSNPVIGPSASPVVQADQALLVITGAAFGSYGGTHYVKFTSGGDNGKFFAIVANDTTTITIDLNGDTLTSVNGNTFSVNKFWTLETLFDPAVTTNSALTTGNAIVNSATISNANRRTQILFADTTTANINLATSAIYYVLAAQVGPPATAAQWRRVGDATLANQGGVQLWPDIPLKVRHPVSVTSDTTYTCPGEVDSGNTVIPLYTRIGTSTAQRDNPRMLTRPVDVTLNGLNLGGGAAFVTSNTISNANRRDTLLVFNNSTAAFNKSASAIYYWLAAQVGPPATPAQWRKVGDATLSDVGTDVIPAGSGFVIRKYGTVDGATSFWNNTPTY